jgi:hypothetical protein
MTQRANYKDVICKMPLAAKVLNRKKWISIGVKLDSLEARLRQVEQPDKRTPRGTSGLGADHHGRVND